MCTTHLQTIHASEATTRSYGGGGPEGNTFEQVSSDGHQMSVARGKAGARGIPGLMPGDPVQWGPRNHGWWSHGAPPPSWTDRMKETRLNTLPPRNSVGGP